MPYRVIFWKPKPGINVWLPAKQPLGEEIRSFIRQGGIADSLIGFPAHEMLQKLKHAFPGARFRDDGELYWTDDIENGFSAYCGQQYVEVYSWELDEDDLERVFEIAERFVVEHYDWGN